MPCCWRRARARCLPRRIVRDYNRSADRRRPSWTFGQYSDDTQLGRELLLNIRESRGFDPSRFAREAGWAGPGWSLARRADLVPVRPSCSFSGTRENVDSRSPFTVYVAAVWTGVRVAEGAGLENRYTRKGIVGSNPTLSAVPF